jgi:hypothetical protein
MRSPSGPATSPGAAIALLCGEHRESVNIGFLCTTRDGMRELRATADSSSLGNLLRPVPM